MMVPFLMVYPPTMRLAGTCTLKMGSQVEESWCTSLRVGVPRSNTPGSLSSIITMQEPLMRSSPESTAAVTKLAKPMLVMKRPRFSTCRSGSWPSAHSDRNNHHAGTLDAIVPGIDRSGNEIGEAHVGDEAAALFHVQERLLAVRPFRAANFAPQPG